ncbi:MAG: BrnT family toxin [Elusimicrobia bacterium]|nr:BrnT family toxin [Elusimicrobiota bacterium]
MRFDWDEAKNRENIRKHGVSFQEAQTIFFDDQARGKEFWALKL